MAFSVRGLSTGLLAGFLLLLGFACQENARCGPGTCFGCCDATGTCQAPSTLACGVNGAVCQACAGTQACTAGSCLGGEAVGGGDGGSADSTGAACTSHDGCAAGVCSRATGRCIGCRTSADCAAGLRCENSRCVAAASCTGDRECTASGKVCDTAASLCVDCNAAADCGDAGPCLGHSCVLATRACTSSLQCSDLDMVCGAALPPAWPSSYLGKGCGECNATSDCGAGEACLERLCQPVCRDAHRSCGTYQGATCGSCPAGGDCLLSGTGCVRRLAQLGMARFLVDGKDRVFAGSDGRGGGSAVVVEVLESSGQVRTLVSSSTYLDGVAVNSTHLFFAAVDGTIKKRSLQAGTVSLFAQVPGSSSSWCQGIAANDAFVVCSLVDYDDTVLDGLYVFPAAGGEPRLLTQVVQASILVNETHVYWADYNGARIGRTPLAGGASQTLSTQQGKLAGILGGYLYFSVYPGGVWRVALSGGQAAKVLDDHRYLGGTADRLFSVDGQGLVYQSALDGTHPALVAPSDELSSNLQAVFSRADHLVAVGDEVVVLGR